GYNEPGSAATGQDGGAIANDATLTITSSTLSENRAGNGGGAANEGTPWCGNGGNGAGIANTRTLVLSNSTVSQNRNGRGGRGPSGIEGLSCLWNVGAGLGGSGGGLANVGTATLDNSTLSDNVTGSTGPTSGSN